MYPYLLLIVVVIIYAGNIIVGKAISDLPPFSMAFFRLFIAFIILLPIGFRSTWTHRMTFFIYKKPLLIMAISGITLFNTFIYGALQFTTASNVSVLEAMIPVATIILSAFLLEERLKKTQWMGVLLSFIGAVWVIIDGSIIQILTMNWNVGDALMIGAILSWALYSVFVKKYMHLFPAYAILLVMTGVSLILLLPTILIEWTIIGIPPIDQPKNIIGLLYLGIFPSLIALVFYNRAVDLLSATKASVLLNFLPVFTIIGAYFWLDETVSKTQLIGTCAVIYGVLLTTEAFSRARPKE